MVKVGLELRIFRFQHPNCSATRPPLQSRKLSKRVMHSKYIWTLAHTGHSLHGVSALSDGSLILAKESPFIVPAAHSCWKKRVAVENPVLEGQTEYYHCTSIIIIIIIIIFIIVITIIVCSVCIMEWVQLN